jgi:hypothetical protein
VKEWLGRNVTGWGLFWAFVILLYTVYETAKLFAE